MGRDFESQLTIRTPDPRYRDERDPPALPGWTDVAVRAGGTVRPGPVRTRCQAGRHPVRRPGNPAAALHGVPWAAVSGGGPEPVGPEVAPEGRQVGTGDRTG